MPGSKTRFGFSGGSEPPPSDPEGEISPRTARTMIGHEIHLRAPPDLRPAATAAPPPREEAPVRVPAAPREEAVGGVPETVTDETTEELPLRPSHTGKSKFPALARLFGRWTTGGRFLSRSRMSGIDDDFSEVPREAWVSRAGVFVLAALLSFLVAMVVLKLHRCSTTVSRPSTTMQKSSTPATQAVAAGSVAPAVLPAPSPPPGLPVPASPLSAARTPVPSRAQPPGVRPKLTHRAARTTTPGGANGKFRSQPARPNPLTLPTGQMGKDALLPLNL